jgi:hypothetical protein
MATKKTTQSVLVTTAHRGVFWGRLVRRKLESDGLTVVLEGARCGIRWSTTGGFLELAEKGPNTHSKIGSVAPRLELRQVTSISDCTPEATAAWEKIK